MLAAGRWRGSRPRPSPQRHKEHKGTTPSGFLCVFVVNSYSSLITLLGLLFRRRTADRLDDNLLLGNIGKRRLLAALHRGELCGRGHIFDLVHNVHALNDFAEDGIAGPATEGVQIAVVLDVDVELGGSAIRVA